MHYETDIIAPERAAMSHNHLLDLRDRPMVEPVRLSPYTIDLSQDDAGDYDENDYRAFYESLPMVDKMPTSSLTPAVTPDQRFNWHQMIGITLKSFGLGLKYIGVSALLLASLTGIICAVLVLWAAFKVGGFAGSF